MGSQEKQESRAGVLREGVIVSTRGRRKKWQVGCAMKEGQDLPGEKYLPATVFYCCY